MTTDLNPASEQNTTDQAELDDLLAELEARTKTVEKTIAASLSDSAYIQALRDVQITATKVVEKANHTK